MSVRSRLEAAALVAALVMTLAFVVSAALGVDAPGDEPTPAAADAPEPEDTASITVVPTPPAGPESKVRVEVLNGTGRSGLARAVTERLRAQGYDVVYFGNAGDGPWGISKVIDRDGNEAAARGVARALGIENVQERRDSTLLLDVTVVIGKDWLMEEASAAAPAAQHPSLWKRLFGGAGN